MIPLVTNKQVRAVDSFAIEKLKFPSMLLMENAASSLLTILQEKNFLTNVPSTIGVLCGKGNNGGDGFALARKMAFLGHTVIVFHLANPNEFSSDAKKNYELLLACQKFYKTISVKRITKAADLTPLKKCTLLVDALLGSGSQGGLNGRLKDVVEKVNTLPTKKVAVDVPTGLNADTGWGETVFNADVTISLGALKRGLFFAKGYQCSGTVEKGSIGLGENFFQTKKILDFLVEKDDIKNFLPQKSKTLNKYSSGKVLLITGSKAYAGAASLSSLGAFKSGAGAVFLAVPSKLQSAIIKQVPETVLRFYGDNITDFLSLDHYSELKREIEKVDVIGIGSGLGRNETTLAFVRYFLKNNVNKKIVLDADALAALHNGFYKKLKLHNVIFTPHLGEFSALLGVAKENLETDILSFGRAFVKETKSILVLKGPRTITFAPDGKSYINSTGNEGLAKFGSGDVLTGMISSFLSQMHDSINAVVSAVYLHGAAADKLKNKKSAYGFSAKEVAAMVPLILKETNNAL